MNFTKTSTLEAHTTCPTCSAHIDIWRPHTGIKWTAATAHAMNNHNRAQHSEPGE